MSSTETAPTPADKAPAKAGGRPRQPRKKPAAKRYFEVVKLVSEVAIWIGRLPAELDEDAFKALVESFGSVKEFKVMKPKERPPTDDGEVPVRAQFAYVTYDEAAAATKAIADLAGKEFGGATLETSAKKYSKKLSSAKPEGEEEPNGNGKAAEPAEPKPADPKKIYLGMLPKESTEEEVAALAAKFGNVVSCRRVSNRTNGYAYIDFSTEDEAAAAVAGLNGSTMQDAPIKAEAARPKAVKAKKAKAVKNQKKPGAAAAPAPVVNTTPMAQRVFVGDLLKTATLEILQAAFPGLQDSSKIRKRSGRTSAYLDFDSVANAEAAIAKHGTEAYAESGVLRIEAQKERVSQAQRKAQAAEGGGDKAE